MTLVEEIAIKSSKLPVARQHEVLDFVEFVGQRCRDESIAGSGDERRKDELLQRGRELMERARQRNAHLTEEEIEREVEAAVSAVRQRDRSC